MNYSGELLICVNNISDWAKFKGTKIDDVFDLSSMAEGKHNAFFDPLTEYDEDTLYSFAFEVKETLGKDVFFIALTLNESVDAEYSLICYFGNEVIDIGVLQPFNEDREDPNNEFYYSLEGLSLTDLPEVFAILRKYDYSQKFSEKDYENLKRMKFLA